LKILIIHLVEFKKKGYHQDHFTFLKEEEIENHLTIYKALASFESINYKESTKEELDSIKWCIRVGINLTQRLKNHRL